MTGPSERDPAPPVPRNPFVGPRPIEEGGALYGRDREVSALFHQLQARRVVLLHSPSGAGKSSLVQAGLTPRLREAKFDVWPAIRVNFTPPDRDRLPVGHNRYLLSAMLSLESELPAEVQRSEAQLAAMDFTHYIRTRPRKRRQQGRPVVLIFDQFEEILTTDPRAIDEKRAFFDAIGAALDGGELWALFSIREDYLGALAPFRERIPTQLSNTFRLDMLTREAAREVAERGAEAGGRLFLAVDQLIDDLSRITASGLDGERVETQGLYVEPVQLQVVCRRLWEAMPAEVRTIEADHIAAFADVSTALAGYYADTVSHAAAGDERQERAIREWVGGRLIVGGIRTPVRREAERSGGLDNRLIVGLVDSYLVRGEQRAGAIWYELSHDRMVGPILEDNARWEEANLHAVQVQAKLWERGRRAPSLLLNAASVSGAVAWAAQQPGGLTEVEAEFLARSVEARDRELRARRSRRLVVLALLVGMLVAMGFAAYAQDLAQRARRAEAAAVLEKEKAIASEQRARTNEQAAIAAGDAARSAEENARVQERQATLAQQQALDAADRAAVSEGEARRQAAAALSQKSAAEAAERQARDSLNMQAVSALSHDPAATLPFLASVRQPELARGWREAAEEALNQTLPVNVLPVPAARAVAMARDRVVVGTEDGRVLLWRSDHAGSPVELAADLPWIREIAVSGERVAWISGGDASGLGRGQLWLWSGGSAVQLKISFDARALAFSPDGALAIGAGDGGVWVLPPGGATPQAFARVDGGVMSLSWSAAPARLAVATQIAVYLVSEAGEASLGFNLDPGQYASRVALSPDAGRVAVLTEQGGVVVWGGGQPPRTLRGVMGVKTLAFVGAEHDLVLGYSAGELGFLPGAAAPERRLRGHSAAVIGLAAGGARFVSLSADGTARVWPTTPRSPRDWATAELPTLIDEVERQSHAVCVAAEDRTRYLDESAALAQARARDCIDGLGF